LLDQHQLAAWNEANDEVPPVINELVAGKLLPESMKAASRATIQ
jgi:hypothetical protein